MVFEQREVVAQTDPKCARKHHEQINTSYIDSKTTVLKQNSSFLCASWKMMRLTVMLTSDRSALTFASKSFPFSFPSQRSEQPFSLKIICTARQKGGGEALRAKQQTVGGVGFGHDCPLHLLLGPKVCNCYTHHVCPSKQRNIGASSAAIGSAALHAHIIRLELYFIWDGGDPVAG